MATLTIRDLDEELKSALQVQAARHGRTMEEEARCILRQALAGSSSPLGLGQRLTRRFQAVATDLAIPPRALPRTPPEWDASA
uniref:Plasmid stabilization protein n=1 Tax=Desulfacinum infernum TaxID=35837 RepID=A0A832A2R0_9BACT